MVGPSGILTPTPAQRRVADPRRSAWVVANAGTGKTRVLTDRVLRLLLDGADPAGILCLTFTRAAAAEMTARIEARLAGWATAPDGELAADLEALLGAPPDGPTQRRARRLFARVLEMPRGLAIQTIHAFCGELLRRFPLEAEIPPHFETADEGKARELFAEAREQVLAEAAERPESPLGRALERLAAELADGSLFEALDELRRLRRPLLAAVEEHGGLEGLLEALAAALGVDPGEDEAKILAAACADGAFDREGLTALVRWWESHGSVTARRAAAALGAWLARDPSARPDTLGELFETVFRKDGGPNGNILRLKGFRESDVVAVYKAEADRWQAVFDRVRARHTLARSEALLRIGHAVLRRYDARMQREALLDFDDLITHTRRLLERGTAWVLYKLDARIEHVLVDEAQDTSPEQWRIVEAILDEFLAGAGAHDRPRTFFVVGDEKQSIYSFQGADVENFRRVRRRLLERARAGGHPVVDETLAESFRATEAVLGLVDRLFATVPEVRSGVVAEDGALRHEVRRRGEAGMVELWPLYRPDRSDGDDDGPWPLPEPRRSRDPAAVVAEAVARTIRDWIRRGEPLAARGRPVRPGDFLLLVRRRGVIQELVVRALKRHGVPVAGVDRMALDAHLAVMDLVALGRAVLLPEDDYTFACLLKSPLLGLDEDRLFALAHDRGGRSLFARLREFARRPGAEGEPWREILERFERWRARADFVPPYEFYAWVLGAEGGRARLLERLGPDAAEPLEAFLAKALAFEEGHPASLEGFLHWFTLGAGELVRDPGKAPDAVRVTTVHGAKGLEAPVVFLLDAGPHRPPRERSPLLWLGAEERPPLPVWRGRRDERPGAVAAAAEAEAQRRAEEENRLLYVALTRAADRLVVTGWAGADVGDEVLDRCWHGCIRRALETLEGVEREPVRLADGFAGEILRWRRGQPRPAAETEARSASPAVDLPAWIRRPATPEPTTAPCAPSAAVADDEAEAPPSKDGKGRERGAALHLLLQHLPAVPEARRREVAAALLQAEHPDLVAELDRLLAAAERVMALPEIAAAFGPGARAEQPVAGMVDGRPVVGRVDRFAVEDGRVLLVDFKTHPRPPDRVPEGILRQMRHYARILRGLYPDRRIEAAVVWTALPRVDVLDLSDDPPAGPEGAAGPAAADPAAGDGAR